MTDRLTLGSTPADMTVWLVADAPFAASVTADAAFPAAPELVFDVGGTLASTLSGDSLTAAWLLTAEQVDALTTAGPSRVTLRDPATHHAYAAGRVYTRVIVGSGAPSSVPAGGALTVDTLDGNLTLTYSTSEVDPAEIEAAVEDYLAEHGGGGGVELVSGVTDLDGTGSPVREFYCTASATIEGVAFAAGTMVVFRRTPAGVWGYIVVDSWTDISAATTTTTTTTAATTTTTTTSGGLDVTEPTAGVLSAVSRTADGFTLLATGAADETALHETPYSYSIDDGTTWPSGWIAYSRYTFSNVANELKTCKHRVRDAAGNIAVGASIVTYPNTGYRNASNYLTIPTYDGSGQAVHPSVVDFGSAWNGWRYWMAMTPYPFSDDTKEDPSIIVSADGLTWQEPAGITNPIHPWSGVAGEYNSDTELVYDPDEDRLICYWRADVSEVTTIYAQTSTDGITWSSPISQGISAHPLVILSPSIVRRGAGDWWMFTIHQVGPNNNESKIEVRTSADPLTGWSAATAYTTINATNLWHCGVLWDGSAWRMLASTGGVPNSIRALSSADGYTWSETAGNVQALTTVDSHAWDTKMYRACFSIKDGSTFRVWYSGRGTDNTGAVGSWHIGYTELPRSIWPAASATTTTTTTVATTTTTTTAATTTTTTTVGGWVPTSVTGLALWLDAADTASITDAGAGAVSQWNDKSGNNRHVTQATSGNRPTTGGTLGGKNALTFGGTHTLRTANGAYQPTSMSVFMVASTTSLVATGWGVLWPHHPTSWSSPWARHGLARSVTKLRGTIETSNTESSTFQVDANTPLQFAFTAGDAKLYKNGNLLITGAAPSPATYPNSVPIIIGAASNNTEGWSGPIAEVVIVDGTVSSGDREKIEGYLAHKWGLTAGLPGAHPYKSTPPA